MFNLNFTICQEEITRKNKTFSGYFFFLIGYSIVLDYYDLRLNGELGQELPDFAVVLNAGPIFR